jgi:hypothetical protein
MGRQSSNVDDKTMEDIMEEEEEFDRREKKKISLT